MHCDVRYVHSIIVCVIVPGEISLLSKITFIDGYITATLIFIQTK